MAMVTALMKVRRPASEREHAFQLESIVDDKVESSSIPFIYPNGNTKIFSKVDASSNVKLIFH